MKRVLLLSLVIVAGSALVAQAAPVPVTWFSQTRTSVDAVYDKIDVNVTNNGWFATPTWITALSGTWTAPGGKLVVSSSLTADTWQGQTISPAGVAPKSVTYFDNAILASAGGTWARDGVKVGTVQQSSLLTGEWFTATASKQMSPNVPPVWDEDNEVWVPRTTLLASIYVTKDATNVAYTGGIALSDSTGGRTMDITFPVPEPGTFVLLATGLLGAIAMWVRRRRA